MVGRGSLTSEHVVAEARPKISWRSSLGKRPLLLLCVAAVSIGALAAAALFSGYLIASHRIEPFARWLEAIERRLPLVSGAGSDLRERVRRLDSIHVAFDGEVYDLPESLGPGRYGGGLASWGDDLLVMTMAGEIYYFDGARGLRKAAIAPPDQGREGLIEIAKRYPGRNSGENELKFVEAKVVETGPHRGLYVSYTYVDAVRECYRSRVAQLRVPASVSDIRHVSASSSDWQVVFETNPCLPFNTVSDLMFGYMAGGGLSYREPGLLYLAVGDYYLDGAPLPDVGLQSEATDYGKVVEIDLNSGKARHFDIGHRNVQHMAFDPDGRLWSVEHGPHGGDEINIEKEGANYGWPVQTYGASYYGSVDGWDGRHADFDRPIFAFLPSVGLSSIAFLSNFEDRWDGDILFGSLVGETLYHAREREGRIVFIEAIPIGERIRDVRQFGPNRIALWLNTNQLVVLTVRPRADPLTGMEQRLVAAGHSAEAARAAVQVLPRCLECHSLREGEHLTGPSLAGLQGRRVASTSFEGYSAALRGRGGTWNERTLQAYLIAPEKFAPGTAMTSFGVRDGSVAAAVIDTLENLESDGR